jgi:hypothetical protein
MDTATSSPDSTVPVEVDPCSEHTDEVTCLADTANLCTWYNLGIPCVEGEPCVSGVCQRPPSGGGDDGGCGCVCPECVPGETCPPCDCSPIGAGSAPGGSDGP